MNISLFFIFAFLAFSLFVGIRARKGKDMNLEQWTVGGRGFGTIFVFLLMAGEWFTTFTFLGGSGGTYGLGMPMIYIYNSFYFIVAYWLLPPIWRYAKKHNLLSQADFFVKKYNSAALGVLVSIVAVVSLVPYLVIQLKGLGIIVSEASYGAISPTLAIWIGVLTVTVYVTISGIHGSAWTSVVKDIIMLVVIVFMGVYLPYHYYGGFKPMFQEINAVSPELLKFSDSGLSVSWYISTTLLWALGTYMWPHWFTAVYSSKNEKVLRRNAGLLPIYQIILVFTLFIGFAAVLQVPGLKGSETNLVLFKLAKETFDPWFVGVIGGAGLLAALVPSSMLLMVGSTILSKNVYKVWKPNTSDAQLSRLARNLVPVLAAVCLFFTFKGGETFVTLYLMAYGFVTQLFPSLFFSLLKKNPVTVQGAFAGIIVGVLTIVYTTLANTSFGALFPSLPQFIKDFDIGTIALVINFIVTLGVSAITRKSSLSLKVQQRKVS